MPKSLKETALEVQQIFKQSGDKKMELIRRAHTTMELKQELTNKWIARGKVPRDIAVLYKEQSETSLALVESYSAWLRENPEPRSNLAELASDLHSKSDEEKIVFLANIRTERLHMINVDIPHLERIVTELESVITAIDKTVNHLSMP